MKFRRQKSVENYMGAVGAGPIDGMGAVVSIPQPTTIQTRKEKEEGGANK